MNETQNKEKSDRGQNMIQKLNYWMILTIVVVLSCSGGDKKHQTHVGVIEGTAVQVPALTGGKIEALLVDTGDEVVRGELIAQIDTTDLHFQRRQLSAALAEVRAQEQLASIELEKAKNYLQYMEEKYERFKNLLESESVNQQVVDDLRNQLNMAGSAHQAARQKFAQLGARREQILAQLQAIQKKINDARITAPLSGVVTAKFFERGEAIPPLSPIVELVDLSKVWLKIYLPETLLPAVHLGQEVEVKPDGSHRILMGKITWISPKAEFTPKTILTPDTRTSLVYAVKISIPNKEQVLKIGMPVEVKIAIS